MVEALIHAQSAQGDMKELKPVPYTPFTVSLGHSEISNHNIDDGVSPPKAIVQAPDESGVLRITFDQKVQMPENILEISSEYNK